MVLIYIITTHGHNSFGMGLLFSSNSSFTIYHKNCSPKNVTLVETCFEMVKQCNINAKGIFVWTDKKIVIIK